MTTRTQVQQEWGTAAEIAAYTGVAREVVVDTTNQKLFLMDGSTVGGKAVAMEAYVAAQIAALSSGTSQNLVLASSCG